MDLFTFNLVATVISGILSIIFARNVYKSGVIAGKYNMSYTTNRHRKCVDIFLCNVVITVLLIKLMLFLKRGTFLEVHLLDTSLGQIHATFLVLFVVAVITMRWFITGEDNNKLHKKISKVVLGSYVLILITGTWLMKRLLS